MSDFDVIQLAAPVRNRYFTGRLLSPADFEAEQSYFLEKRRLHNRLLHGWGTVTGLGLSGHGAHLALSPGLALDCLGREIVVPSPAAVPPPAAGGVMYLCLQYAEKPIEPVPSSDGTPEYARVEEGYALMITAVNPAAGHRRSSCGGEHGVPLARLRAVKGGWRHDRRFRPPRVHS